MKYLVFEQSATGLLEDGTHIELSSLPNNRPDFKSLVQSKLQKRLRCKIIACKSQTKTICQACSLSFCDKHSTKLCITCYNKLL